MSILLYISSVFCSAGQSAMGKQYARKGGNATVFNINKTAVGTLLFLVVGIVGGFSFHVPTLFLGLAYGACLCISMHTGFRALSMGPMALTSVIASFSLIIPFLCGVIFWNEALTLFKGLGILLLLGSILLINGKREQGFSVKWLLYALATLAANGVCSIVQKLHQLQFPGLYQTEFMFWAMLCGLILFLVTGMVKPAEGVRVRWNFWGLTSGILNCGANYLVLYLSAGENASVLFPVISIANIMAVWAVGVLFFKERLKLQQSMGLLLGAVSVLLLKL